MIKRLDIQDHSIARQVHALQQRSYPYEARLIDYYSIPPMVESLNQLMLSKELFLGYQLDQKLAGILSYIPEEEFIDIYRLAIDPDHFRKGIAKSLLQFLIGNNKGKRIIVSTGLANIPAIELYTQSGFVMVNESLADGLRIAHLSRDAQ